MFRAVVLQVLITFCAALVAGFVVGPRGALSVLAGGAVCVVPNFLFAVRLKFATSRPGSSYPAAFFIGEIIKISLSVGLLFLVVKTYADVHWPSLLIGLVLALQAGVLAFWKKSRW